MTDQKVPKDQNVPEGQIIRWRPFYLLIKLHVFYKTDQNIPKTDQNVNESISLVTKNLYLIKIYT